MDIRKATILDLGFVHEIEKLSEKNHAASFETLRERLEMFPKDFLVVEEENGIVGYVESCLWNKYDFETFEEIKDFPKNHNPNGKLLYVIFIAIHPAFRLNGYGSALIRRLQEFSEEKKLKKIILVAGEKSLPEFYKKLGFKKIKELPNFYNGVRGTLMECGVCKQ